MDDSKMLEIHKKNYRDLIKFKRTFLSRSRRKLLWSRNSIAGANSDTFQTCARTLVDWDILDTPDLVVDFFEKPWKWENEICLLVQILDNNLKDEFSEEVLDIINDCIYIQAGDYYSVIEVTDKKIKEVKEYIEYYKGQLANAV